MIREKILNAWEGLKDAMLSRLDTNQTIKEQMIERYEEKIKKQNLLLSSFEEAEKEIQLERNNHAKLTNFLRELKREVNKEMYDRIIFLSDAERAEFYNNDFMSLKKKIDSFDV